MKRLFISYRRSDTEHFAGRVFDRLRHHVGSHNLFMDVDTIPLGVNFAEFIGGEVAKCHVLLALIGPNWIDARATNGTRRLDDEQDLVRIEIASALRRNIPVVPILLEGTSMPVADLLPDELKPLTSRNALSVRHSSFHTDMDKLVRALDITSTPPTVPIHLDIAERLVVQVQEWFEVLASAGNTPRAFTAVIRDSSQFSVSLEGLPLDHVKRRNFLIWLCTEYDVVAYTYATRVMKQKATGIDDVVEALDLYSSSFDMDVFASLKIIRRPNGIVHYIRDSYVAQEAKEDSGQIFWGLHRVPHDVSAADIATFKSIWAAIGKQVLWQSR